MALRRSRRQEQPPPADSSSTSPPAGASKPWNGLSGVTIDQAISGGSNVLAGILAARLLGLEEFGLFGIIFLIAVTGIGIVRSLLGEPMLVHQVEARERAGEVVGSTLAVGAALGVTFAGIGVLALPLDARIGWSLVVLGACFPGIAVQDLGRYLGFATGQPWRSVRLDVLWLALLVAFAWAAAVAGLDTLPWFVGAWAGSGAVAGWCSLLRYRGERVRYSRPWLAHTWHVSWRYLTSFLIAQGGVLIGTIALSAVVDAEAVGAVRGALLLFSPATTFQIAAGAAGVAHIHRQAEPDAVLRHARGIALLTIAVTGLNLVFLLAVPDAIGEALLDDAWSEARALALPAAGQVAMLGVVIGARAALLGIRAAEDVLRLDLRYNPLLLAATIGGAFIAGAAGSMWAAVISVGLASPIWYRLLSRRLGTVAAGRDGSAAREE